MLNQMYFPRTGEFRVFLFLFPNSVVLCARACVILCDQRKKKKKIILLRFYYPDIQ